MKFQLGGNVPMVFGIDQGFAKPMNVNLAPVIGAASMPVESGLQAMTSLENLDVNRDHLELAKEREERAKTQDKINNLKLISEFADKSSKWGVLPGRKAEFDAIMGPLSDPDALARAATDMRGMTDFISKNYAAQMKMAPLLREKAMYDKSMEAYEKVNNKLIELVKDETVIQFLDTGIKQKLDEWAAKLEDFAINGNGTEADIASYTVGAQHFFDDEKLNTYVEQAKKQKEIKNNLDVAKTNLDVAITDQKIAALEQQMIAAARKIGLEVKPFDQYSPGDKAKINAEIGRQAEEIRQAQVANVNSEIAARTANAKLQEVKANLEWVKTFPDEVQAVAIINNALSSTTDKRRIKRLSEKEYSEIINNLSPEDFDTFMRELDLEKEKLSGLGKSTKLNDVEEFELWINKSGYTMDELNSDPELKARLIEEFRTVRGKQSGVSHGSSSTLIKKNGVPTTIIIGGKAIEAGTTKDTKFPDGIAIVEEGGKGYLKISTGMNHNKLLEFFKTHFPQIDTGADIFSMDFWDIEPKNLLKYRKNQFPPGTEMRNGFIYIPQDGGTSVKTSSSTNPRVTPPITPRSNTQW